MFGGLELPSTHTHRAKAITGRSRFAALGVLFLIVAAACTPLVTAPSEPSPTVLVSDDFSAGLSAGVLDPAWTVVDPLGDGSVSFVGQGTVDSRLSLSVPGGLTHNPYIPNESLRVSQLVADDDFEMVVKFDSVPGAPYQQQGIQVEADAGNWLRFDVHRNPSGLRAYSAKMIGGSWTTVNNTWASAGSSIWLQVTRSGNNWTYATSADGVSFSTKATFSQPLALTKIAVFGGNFAYTASEAPAYTALVDYVFNTASPISPEDPAGPDETPPVMSAVAVAPSAQSATVTWDTNEAASSEVDYGLTNALELPAVTDPAQVTTHSINLAGLSAETTYSYQITSTDGSNNTTTVAIATFTTTSQSSPPSGDVPAPAAAGKEWVLSFGEEFSGTQLDTSKLSPCFDWNYGSCTGSFNGGREWYSAEQIQVSNGSAKLVAEPGQDPSSNGSVCLGGTCTYRSGLLSTARPLAWDGSDYLYKFTYGYVEARMKLPTTQGFFTALWMMPADPSYVYQTEIDIVEVLGYDPTTMYMNYHYGSYRSQNFTPNWGTGNNGACSVEDRTGDWVRFGLDWQPTHIAWYIDGVKCGQFNGDSSTITSVPNQIIVNLMVDHGWERSWGYALADTTLTRQLEIDYLRVYQQQ